MIMNIKLNDEVYIVGESFTPTSKFPVKGSSLESAGTVTSMKEMSFAIKWDNGYEYVYDSVFKRFFERIEPVNYKSIW